MVTKLRKNWSLEFVYSPGEFPIIFDNFGAVSLDHRFPGSIIRMNRELTHNDEATFPLGPSSVIGHMTVGQPTISGEVGPVGQKTDSIGKGDLAQTKRTEEMIEHGGLYWEGPS